MKRLFIPPLLLVAGSAVAAPDLPDAVGGWKATGPTRRYTGKRIYDYMDGAAEVHRMYGFRSLRVREYLGPKRATIRLELFDMGSAAGAFGDFTHARDLEGTEVALGQDGHHQSGVLWFWKGRHLVCVSSRSPNVERSALEEVGRALETRLKSGARPDLVLRLPADGLRGRTVRYFRSPAALRYHYGDFAHTDLLGLDGRAEAVLADYRTRAGASVLLMVRYRSDRAAAAVERRLARKLPLGPQKGEDGKWRCRSRRVRLLRIVLEAPKQASCRALLARRSRLGGGPPRRSQGNP